MRKFSEIIGIVTLVLCVAGIANAEQKGLVVFKGADASPAIRIKYNGSASVATFTNSTTTFTVNDGGTSTAVASSGLTYASLVSSLNAATNSAGKKNFAVEYVGAIGTDVASNLVIAATALVDLTDGKWHEVVLMDTSGVKAYVAGVPGDNYGNYYIDHIYGVPTGTGSVTVNIWKDGVTKLFEKVITSPVYVKAEDNATNVVDNVVNLDVELPAGLMISSGESCQIRATRATTATTGNIGVVFTKR